MRDVRKSLVVAAVLLGAVPATASADGAFVNTVTGSDPDGSSFRIHTVITPGGNFNFSEQEVNVLGPDETIRTVGATNFNANRGSGNLTVTTHATGADIGSPVNVVEHNNFGPNGVKQFCHSNADGCP